MELNITPPEAHPSPYQHEVDRLSRTIPITTQFLSGAAAEPTPKCRSGHLLTPDNVRRERSSGKTRCLTCRRHSQPLKARTCPGCGNEFSGTKRKVCNLCHAKQLDSERLEVSHRPIRTRQCSECHEVHPLGEFLRQGHVGKDQYSTRCLDCREAEDDDEGNADSPYSVARAQVESIFGLPAKEWINVRGHPLNVLHYQRMLAILNSRARRDGQPKKLLSADRVVTARQMWTIITDARLTKRLRAGEVPLTFARTA